MKKNNIFINQSIINGDRTHTSIDDVSTVNEEQLLWQHVDLDQPGAESWMDNDANLEQVVVNALTVDETRPRSFKVKDGLMITLRGLNTDPGHNPEDMVSVRLFIQKNRIVSVRNKLIVAVHDMLIDLNDGDGPRHTGEFLTTLIDKMADRVGDFVNTIEDELSETEENLEVMEIADLRTVLGSLRRQIAVVRRYMAPQRDALNRLNNIDIDILNERDKQLLREESDRVTRYLEDLDLARERAIVLQEAFLSQIAQEQNDRMYSLSIITAIFLPLGFLTGLLGINVGGMPGADNSYAFWLFVASLFIIIGFQYWFFRKLKWF